MNRHRMQHQNHQKKKPKMKRKMTKRSHRIIILLLNQKKRLQPKKRHQLKIKRSVSDSQKRNQITSLFHMRVAPSWCLCVYFSLFVCVINRINNQFTNTHTQLHYKFILKPQHLHFKMQKKTTSLIYVFHLIHWSLFLIMQLNTHIHFICQYNYYMFENRFYWSELMLICLFFPPVKFAEETRLVQGQARRC